MPPQPANEDCEAAAPRRSPLVFFVLVFVLSAPFWWLGAATGIVLLPGVPVSALMAFCPAVAAAILVYRESGSAGVRALLRRSFDAARIAKTIWYVPIFLLMPAVMATSYGAMRVLGWQFPALRFPASLALALFAIFFVTALGEELGWSGYAVDPLQTRTNALEAALVIGLVWAGWHFVPLLQVHRSVAWIAWWSLGTVATRILIVWIYNNTCNSVFAAALFHAMSNVSTLLVPALYDPRTASPILALAAAAVIVLWGPRSLARAM